MRLSPIGDVTRENPSGLRAMSSETAQSPGDVPSPALLSSALLKLKRHQETRQARLGERSKRRSAKRSTDDTHASDLANLPAHDTSCTACRFAKVKCRETGRDCSFPARQKRGPKGPNRRQDDLDLAVEQIQSYLSSLSDQQPPLNRPRSRDRAPRPESSRSSQARQADNHVVGSVPSTSSGALPEHGASCAGRATHGDLDAIFGQTSVVVDVEGSLIGGSAALYDWVIETDLSLDPVNIGILSSDDLDRLIAIYFDRMRPFFWHLDPLLHSPAFLRLNSSFLTTAVAAAAASFDPASAVFADRLREHAIHLGERCFSAGTKSLDAALAFDFLCHWSSPEEQLSHDPRWRYHATAMRIAGEIRLDLPFGPHVISKYKSPDGFALDSQMAMERLDRCRSRAWTLLSCGDISLSLQSGRLDFASLQTSGLAPSHAPLISSYQDPDYNFYANQHLNYVLVNAIILFNSLRSKGHNEDEDLRETFVCAWRPEMIDWQEKYRQRDHFIYLTGLNMEILLCLISLRLRAAERTTRTLLEHSFMLALDVVDRTYQWTFQLDAAEQLAYASNYMLINIAYAPVLLLRVASSHPMYDLHDIHEKCERIAAIFEVIDQLRSNATSFALVYSRQIRSMVEESKQKSHRTATADMTSAQSAVSNSLSQDADQGIMPLLTDLSGLDATQLAILRSDMWDILGGFT